MKSSALSTALLAICVAASAPTFAQHATKTPTAEVDELPRSADDLGFGNRLHDRKDSLLTGGSSGPLPSDRVPLPSLCDINPGHASCEVDDGGGGGGGPPLQHLVLGNCSFTISPSSGFSEPLNRHRGELTTCSQGGMFTSWGGGRGDPTLVSVAPQFMVVLGSVSTPEVTVSWRQGDCAIAQGPICTAPQRIFRVNRNEGDPGWNAQATVRDAATGQVTHTLQFSASFEACGVLGGAGAGDTIPCD